MSEEQETKEPETKVKTSVSLSQYLHSRVEELVKKKEFTSRSDLISTALGEFFGHYDERVSRSKQKKEGTQKEQVKSGFEVLLEAYMNTSEGQEFIKNLSKKNNSNNKKDCIVLFGEDDHYEQDYYID